MEGRTKVSRSIFTGRLGSQNWTNICTALMMCKVRVPLNEWQKHDKTISNYNKIRGLSEASSCEDLKWRGIATRQKQQLCDVWRTLTISPNGSNICNLTQGTNSSQCFKASTSISHGDMAIVRSIQQKGGTHEGCARSAVRDTLVDDLARKWGKYRW